MTKMSRIRPVLSLPVSGTYTFVITTGYFGIEVNRLTFLDTIQHFPHQIGNYD